MCALILKDIIVLANNGQIPLEVWESYFKPLMDEDNGEKQFIRSNWDELIDEATKHAVDNDSYIYHIWAIVDGDDGKLIALNGIHQCNVLHHIVCEVPYVANLTDKNVYIEVEYE